MIAINGKRFEDNATATEWALENTEKVLDYSIETDDLGNSIFTQGHRLVCGATVQIEWTFTPEEFAVELLEDLPWGNGTARVVIEE